MKFYWRKVGFSFEQIERPKQCNMATITAKALEQMMQAHVKAETGLSLEQANPRDYWTALSKSIVEIISENWMASRHKYNQGRQAHYFSAEFLEGRSMLNNLVNLGIYDQAKEALASFGLDITDILEEETDPALGNGGLGRLAACFLDSCATLNLPVTGYGILYRYGLFGTRQAVARSISTITTSRSRVSPTRSSARPSRS